MITHISYLLLVILFSLNLTSLMSDTYRERQVYIVYMGHVGENDYQPTSNMLQEVFSSRSMNQSLLRIYKRSFNGFAAYLTTEEYQKLLGHEKVVSIFPNTILHTQTTRSWDFMGIPISIQRKPAVESDIIIGVIDSGIWPESESFSDRGLGPPPKKWRGACEGGLNFTCNNKLIGVRYYTSGDPSINSARDDVGHGTHTASIAAGNEVSDASFYGIASGTARGGVPSARIAAYKACGKHACTSVDLLSAFDDAIADGVDIISISIVGEGPLELTSDPVAIGAFHASQRDIVVVQSAGNYGTIKVIQSFAPWIFSVAASSTDRAIATRVSLGDQTQHIGKSVNAFTLHQSSFPLVTGEQVTHVCSKEAAQSCDHGCLDPSLAAGKVVLCNNYKAMGEVFRVGGIGAVVPSGPATDVSLVVPVAASALKDDDFRQLQDYCSSTDSPEVSISVSELERNMDAPRVASFSSRGINMIFPDILKPDVTAPGVEILAAFSPLGSVWHDDYSHDKRAVKYSILSGTSMACPHVVGAVAYVKSFHPYWSASALKSALMTTAWTMDSTEDPSAEFSYGAGHINPKKALDPGLVYETSAEEYLKLLCGLGYNSDKMVQVFGANCPKGATISPKDLNYPSLTIRVTNSAFSERLTRTVTNVGPVNSTYKVSMSKSRDYSMSVKPDTLTFGAVDEKKSFEVVISGRISGKMLSASIEWSDGFRVVRSPVVVYTEGGRDSVSSSFRVSRLISCWGLILCIVICL